ncbi:diguanylate cyclase AdrA [Edaphovirga cremea]|uniref:diguanylate cyclase AdrA n=1 Tax=Edaphovirga cremea TaxID=2267246 RepID=UPI0039894B01
MPIDTLLKPDPYRSGLSFVKRVYAPRVIGLGGGFFCVASVLMTQPVVYWVWGLLLINGFIWPHVAYRWAIRSPQPFGAEIRNLMIDALFGGAWVAMIGFNALPSAIIISMMGMNNIAAGGKNLFFKALGLQVLGGLVVSLIARQPLAIATTPMQVYICLPMLMIYPISLGLVTYRTARHLAEHKKKLFSISVLDGLTGINNRRYWEHLLHNEYDRCTRYQHTATLILLDIDHFKSINDTYGHSVGDEAILMLTDELRLSLRMVDVIGRYGGDEFGVILPDTHIDQAYLVAQRLREKISVQRLKNAPDLILRISAGIAEYQPSMEGYQEWLKAADIALYRAKKAGRNRTERA